MKLSGEYRFWRAREVRPWASLNDPETLRRIIPGCERLEQIGDDLYSADTARPRRGARQLCGTVRISEQQPPERYRLEGATGAANPASLRVSATSSLRPRIMARRACATLRTPRGRRTSGRHWASLIQGHRPIDQSPNTYAANAELEARQSSRTEDDDKEPEAETVASPSPTQTALELPEHAGAPALPPPLPIASSRRELRYRLPNAVVHDATIFLRGTGRDMLHERPAFAGPYHSRVASRSAYSLGTPRPLPRPLRQVHHRGLPPFQWHRRTGTATAPALHSMTITTIAEQANVELSVTVNGKAYHHDIPTSYSSSTTTPATQSDRHTCRVRHLRNAALVSCR